MSIGGFGDVPQEEQPHLQQPPEDTSKLKPKKAKVDFSNLNFQGTLQEVQRLVSTDSNLPRVTQLIQQLFSSVDHQKKFISDTDLKALNNVTLKLKSLPNPSAELIKELQILENALNVNDRAANPPILHTTQHTITSAQLEQMTTEQFWQTITHLLTDQPKLQKVQIEINGKFESFDRADIISLIQIQTHVDPRNLRKYIDTLSKSHFSLREYQQHQYPPLHLHVIAGRENLVTQDLSKSNLEAKDKNGLTALQWACFLGDVEIAKQLIDAGAELHSSSLLQAILGQHPQTVELLFYAGLPFKITDQPLLLLAAEKGNLRIIELIFSEDADIDYQNQRDGRTALHFASERNHADIVEFLLQQGADTSLLNDDGDSALCTAVKKGSVEAVSKFIENGCDVNECNEEGTPILSIAVLEDNHHVAKLLLEHGADSNLASKDKGWTPLLYATMMDNIDLVRLLLANTAQVNAQDKNGLSALMIAISNSNTDIAELLIQNGADITATDNQGHSVLYQLQFIRPIHFKKLKKSLEKTSSVAVFAKVKTFANLYKSTLLLSHAYEIKGTSLIDATKVTLEGSSHFLSSEECAKTISEFAKLLPDILDKTTARHLSQSLFFASDSNSHTPVQSLERIKRGLPTIILTGYKSHSACVLIYKDLFIHCDRGGTSNSPLNIYRYNPTKLTPTILEEISDISGLGSKDYDLFFKKSLPASLGFTQNPNELELQQLATLAMQIVGNCSWAAVEGIIKAFLLVEPLKDTNFILPESITEKSEHKKSNDSIFDSWLLYQRIELLDKYLNNPVDRGIVFVSFSTLWATKTSNVTLQNRIRNLEAKYKAKTTYSDYLAYLTNKTMCLIFPFPRVLQYQQGYLDFNTILSPRNEV